MLPSNEAPSIQSRLFQRSPMKSSKGVKSAPTSPLVHRSRGHAHSRSDCLESRFHTKNHSQAGSVYTLSRVSFSTQIAQLMSIHLPEAATLARSIAAISTSVQALIVLEDAAYQIQRWIRKAAEVLDGLDADDNIEWAAAAGRQGVVQIDQAINRFEVLINIYMNAVEGLQQRKDASLVPAKDLNRNLDHFEDIATMWESTKATLGTVKYQVELSLEWEGIRKTVFGEIGVELAALCKAIFELEELRHQGYDGSDNSMDREITQTPTTHSTRSSMSFLRSPMDSPRPSDRESTIPVEAAKSRFSPSVTPQSSLSQAISIPTAQEDALLGLFARMQPLRASLDFLPMRSATFKSRAALIFPSACQGLEDYRTTLEHQWTRLEQDAETLRKELSEDRWLLVFRNAAKQALRMIDSVARSVAKVDESLDSDTRRRHAPSTLKKIESFQAKKQHYGPAIERMMAIVATGLNERKTINGEIIRLQADVCQKWSEVKATILNLESILSEYKSDIDGSINLPLREPSPAKLSSDRYDDSSPIIARIAPAFAAHPSRKSSFQELRSRDSRVEAPKLLNPANLRTSTTPNYRPLTPLLQRATSPKNVIMDVGHRTPSTPRSTPSRPNFIRAPSNTLGKPRWNSSTKVEEKPRPSMLRSTSGTATSTTSSPNNRKATPFSEAPLSSSLGPGKKPAPNLPSPPSTWKSRRSGSQPPPQLPLATNRQALQTPPQSSPLSPSAGPWNPFTNASNRQPSQITTPRLLRTQSSQRSLTQHPTPPATGKPSTFTDDRQQQTPSTAARPLRTQSSQRTLGLYTSISTASNASTMAPTPTPTPKAPLQPSARSHNVFRALPPIETKPFAVSDPFTTHDLAVDR